MLSMRRRIDSTLEHAVKEQQKIISERKKKERKKKIFLFQRQFTEPI
jgi:hypothetical protein